MDKRWIISGCALAAVVALTLGLRTKTERADVAQASEPAPSKTEEATPRARKLAQHEAIAAAHAPRPQVPEEPEDEPPSVASAERDEALPPLETPPITNDQVILDNAFDKETVDAHWGREVRPQIDQALEPLVPASSRVKSRECRSTLCRAEIEHSAAGDHLSLIATARKGVTWPGEMVIVRELKADGQVATIAYFARAGQHMPELF